MSKKLLWNEYMENCRANGEEPLMYSQFCYHIQQDERKHRATRNSLNVLQLFITDATGYDKTYMACVFGMEACKQYFNTRYVRLPDLLIDLEMARSDGGYKKVMAKYANPLMLIIDECLFLKPTEEEQRDIFEHLYRRRKKSSTIFCSQYEYSIWYDQLGGDDSSLADAIIDRIAHDSYIISITSIDLKNDRSMLEVYGLEKALVCFVIVFVCLNTGS